MNKINNESKINKEVKRNMKIIDTQLKYLSSLSIKELKKAYENYNVPWIYIAELKNRRYITQEEMNIIVGCWK